VIAIGSTQILPHAVLKHGKMSESISNDSSMSKRKSYIGFLKEIVKLKAVPQLLFIFAMTSFGSGMINNIVSFTIVPGGIANYVYKLTI